MAHKWSDIRKGPPPKPPLSPEEFRVQAERLARLDKFCEGMDSEAQFELLELAHRYTDGEIPFSEIEDYARQMELARKFMKDRREALGELAIGPTTEAAMEEAHAGKLESFDSVEALMVDLNAEDSRAEQTPEPSISSSSKLGRDEHGFLIVKDSVPAITSEMVREESEDDLG